MNRPDLPQLERIYARHGDRPVVEIIAIRLALLEGWGRVVAAHRTRPS